MALNGCYSCLKFLVFTINFLLWLFGLGVVAVSLWLLFDSDLYLQTMSDQRTDYYLGTYIILAIGALVTIMGRATICLFQLEEEKSVTILNKNMFFPFEAIV